MKNKILKVVVFVILLGIILSFVSTNVFALTDIAANSYTKWNYNESTSVINSTKSVMATAIKVVQIVTMGIAVIMMLMIAIKYMSASPEGKADFKKSATGYIVGAVVMFGVSGLLEIIQKFATNL